MGREDKLKFSRLNPAVHLGTTIWINNNNGNDRIRKVFLVDDES